MPNLCCIWVEAFVPITVLKDNGKANTLNFENGTRMNKYALLVTLIIAISLGSLLFVDMSGHNGAYHILLLVLLGGPALLIVFVLAYLSDRAKRKDNRRSWQQEGDYLRVIPSFAEVQKRARLRYAQFLLFRQVAQVKHLAPCPKSKKPRRRRGLALFYSCTRRDSNPEPSDP